MRVDGVNVASPVWTYRISATVTNQTAQSATLMNEDTMKQLLNAITYNQFGIATKLAKIAGEMYSKLNMLG
ncbi:MAG TPA: hypothetical protein DHV12_01390 [Thermotogae bacterium]|nr:hypothetical protein [Thermotogota bacterium]